ncbi:hypothetical protein COY61_01565 [bacterium (Candidatus Gribaldobacteria) CG_4_10_14_0_8_um_filter_33_9]|uniref:Uncharacterized protein n=1 Tax=bacterium (Candidatus Gribaldobacteria) CG_4_10_14_0_8_um_filter_33_9 TaxID=2014266 RepID=A0A2M7RMS9_9BACT|nr:MAG: hypothetical protein COY61_01565 [bacterium (Candidatus Gribaldobacteria) CG_4_10_14_0_8_um_filter_33_9]
MKLTLHKNATTTITTRQIIKKSFLSAFVLAKKYGISQTTALDGKTLKALPKNKRTKKIHVFDIICQKNKIEHRIFQERFADPLYE